MNQKQMEVAKENMIEWLSHPNELGKAPKKIELAGTFEMDDMLYYMFKYKKGNLFGEWLLGVVGGYEENELEHCGHIFSEMEIYDSATAEEKARNMVQMVKEYWMKEATKYEEDENKETKDETGSFLGFALLSKNVWNKEQLISDLQSDWGIEVTFDPEEEKDDEEDEDNEESLVFQVTDEIMIAVSLMPAPVPYEEAVHYAKTNYMWPDAEKVAKEHKAHFLVAVLGKSEDPYEKGMYFTKVMATCCKQENVTGIYTSGTVFAPNFYQEYSKMMREGLLPIFNWIYFGLYHSEKGVNAYTYGLKLFGKVEMEVLDADGTPEEVYNFLTDLTSYVLNEDVVLQDGETIGFSADDKHSITLSEGVALPGKTLKISYKA